MQTNFVPNIEIKHELYRALVLLGADNGLLGAIGSWGESLPDSDVLANLRGWNQEMLREAKERIEHYEMTSRRPAYSPVVDRQSAPVAQ